MESGRAPLQIRRCSLLATSPIKAIESMTGMADSSTVRLELMPSHSCANTHASEALFFDGDSDRILQVLTNLLSNAVKFSPAASTVRIFTEATADSILFKVADEGRGIPAEQLDTIFDRFQQVRALRTPARRAAPASGSPSAAASFNNIAAPSGLNAT